MIMIRYDVNIIITRFSVYLNFTMVIRGQSELYLYFRCDITDIRDG